MAGSVKFILPTNKMPGRNNRQKRIATRATNRSRRITRRLVRRYGPDIASFMIRNLANRSNLTSRLRQRLRIKRRRKAKYVSVRANVAGTTHTTSNMIVRKTPAEQKFLRKLFKDTPNLVKHVNRFAFSWVGASTCSRTIWYSVAHLKFNNVYDYLVHKISAPNQGVGSAYWTTTPTDNRYVSCNPAQFIYIGKCTFNYEIYNPTNYIMTVYIYDLVCKHDTPFEITYGSQTDVEQISRSQPECCMIQSSRPLTSSAAVDAEKWTVGDTTDEVNNTQQGVGGPAWNAVGMKPTDYFCFNSLWKVKGIKKIILPPASSHHHVVVYNPKKKITWGNLVYPRQDISKRTGKYGIGGLTQSTLFGFEGQLGFEKDQALDNEKVGTLPGKIVVKCIRKINCYNFPITSSTVISKNNLYTNLSNPEIFTDLTTRPAETA
ncbi:capsid protein [Cattle blood-associated gemycircularvirus]|uniref:Capsid protein n=1 Tax=Cattle blood-associated gemycircularvirus TaxID=2077296 RepID=A0A2L0HH21_9VIRU|nr:capsid protein [Cattle blood-associated gemycircularvirus]AUX80745.1 capsid protein [Cattle blood-associated gemycircularvirus]